MIDFTFKPIYDENSKVLILGSFPSIISRKNDFYYSNPQNRFWKILEIIYNRKLQNMEEKINLLIEQQIALYDSIAKCDIKNSSDLSIKNITATDIGPILDNSKVEKILCNGRKSYDVVVKKMNKKAILMPSTSSANARYSLDKLVEIRSKELP
ncbi:MAG: DNA-deoxyinosine glycosylase [Tissierellia bacterium]|nr:DNA-deoxyinosine glycosylase [Tissierellia bacterium]